MHHQLLSSPMSKMHVYMLIIILITKMVEKGGKYFLHKATRPQGKISCLLNCLFSRVRYNGALVGGAVLIDDFGCSLSKQLLSAWCELSEPGITQNRTV